MGVNSSKYTHVIAFSDKRFPHLSLVGMAYLDTNEQIASTMYGYGPGYAQSLQTTLTATQLSQKLQYKNYMAYTTISKQNLQAGSTTSKINNRIIWYKQTNSQQPEERIRIRQVGVYLIMLNIIVLSIGSGVSCTVNLHDKEMLFSGQYPTPIGRMVSFPIGGAVVLRKANVDLSVNITGNSGTAVEAMSTLSVIYLHDKLFEYPVIVLKVKQRRTLTKLPTWFSIPSLMPVEMTKFYHQNDFVIPEITGIYMLSCSLIVITRRLM